MSDTREGYVELTVKLAKEDDGRWTAECLELGTAGFGDTLDEAFEIINDLVALHLNALEDAGQCRAFLREHGITFHRLQTKRKPARRECRVGANEFVGVLTERVSLAAAN